jgi:hypothetical protein
MDVGLALPRCSRSIGAVPIARPWSEPATVQSVDAGFIHAPSSGPGVGRLDTMIAVN